MRAFVLGGGGNLGAMQVGALTALFEQGIRPDFLLGCSVGALNATMLACDYSAENLERLRLLWQDVTVQDIFPGNRLHYVWRFLTRQDGLCNNRSLYNFLIQSGITPDIRFGDLDSIRLYVAATNLNTGRLDIFGRDNNVCLLDSLMATSAQPPLLPPWEINGVQYVDGGTVTPLPLRSAVALGATEIYSLRVAHGAEPQQHNGQQKPIRGMTGVVKRSINMMIQQQAEYDLLVARNQLDAKLHEIDLSSTMSSRTDFSSSELLYEEGYEIMSAYLQDRSVRRTNMCEPVDEPTSSQESISLPFMLSHNEAYAHGD